jgi:hypothetical protein
VDDRLRRCLATAHGCLVRGPLISFHSPWRSGCDAQSAGCRSIPTRSCGLDSTQQAGTPQDLQKQWTGQRSLRTGDRYSHTHEEVEYRQSAAGDVGLDRLHSPKQFPTRSPDRPVRARSKTNCRKGTFWLRGRATSGTCSCGAARRETPSLQASYSYMLASAALQAYVRSSTDAPGRWDGAPRGFSAAGSERFAGQVVLGRNRSARNDRSKSGVSALSTASSRRFRWCGP